MSRTASTAEHRTIPAPSTAAPTDSDWSLDEAADRYQIHAWGQGFFAINDAGHVVVRPDRDPRREIDLYEVVRGLNERGMSAPVLIGFGDLLRQRMADLHDAFQQAIDEYGYRGRYCAVYPIKVNQQHHLVEDLQNFGSEYGFGLEVGSKPELLAVLGMTNGMNDRPIICNGFKEDRYIEIVMMATKLGRNIIPVIENTNELRLIVEQAEQAGVRPRIGVRVNLSSPGAGRWRHSSGIKAKFGLSISELLDVFEYLKQRGMADCLKLLHCHIGSQIHDILRVNASINELSRIYAELARMGAGLEYIDIGGGLGVDYDGSQTNSEFSTNYTWAEYAGNVVYRIMNICDDANVEHPTIISESGRAMVAHHSVLVFNVLDANELDSVRTPDELLNGRAEPASDNATDEREDLPRPVDDLIDAYHRVSPRQLLECYHDAQQARQEAMNLFNVGYLSLEHCGLIEQLFWATCLKIRNKCREMDTVPEDLEDIEASLSDTYFCNLSIFQSMPDVWAINQIFPVMPIHRLDEYPSRRATLADITCDSDGRVDRFVDRRDVKQSLELHPLRQGEEYYLGAFLVGAYQETLGDLHNLFGDTHVVHLRFDENGRWWIEQVVEGDTVREVLSYVQYDTHYLRQRIRRECERAVASGRMTVAESRTLMRTYDAGLSGYTYLE